MDHAAPDFDAVKAGAKLTGLSSIAVARLIQAGQIPGTRSGGTIFFSKIPSRTIPL